MQPSNRVSNAGFTLLAVAALGSMLVLAAGELVAVPGWLLASALASLLVVVFAEGWLVWRRARNEGVGWLAALRRSLRDFARTAWHVLMP